MASFSQFCEREDKGLHRSGITAADKLAAVTPAAAKDDTVVGVMAAEPHYFAVAPGNEYGSALPTLGSGPITPTLNKTINISVPRSKGATKYTIFFSTDAAPKELAEISAAQRAAGCAITANGTVGAGGAPGTAQVETITVTHAAAKAGTLIVSVTSALLGTVAVNVAVLASDNTVAKVATKIAAALAADADIAAEFTVAANDDDVVLTAIYADSNDATLAVALTSDGATGVTVGASGNTTAGVAPVCQVETATVVGTITTAGTCAVTFTTALLAEPLVVNVALAEGDEPADAAEKIAAYVQAMDICDYFTIEADGADIVMTAKTAAANDETLNIAYNNGTCEGLTPAATSADTTAGVAPVQQVETIAVTAACTHAGSITFRVTAAGMTGSPVDVEIPLTTNYDTTAKVAAEIRRYLAANANIAAFFSIGGTAANIVLTAITAAANDGTMAMALANNGSTSVTVGESTDTTAGVAPVVNVRLVGTGAASNADPFKFSNAYDLDDITPIWCAGRMKADVYVKLALTDLRSAPTFAFVPFLYNKTLGEYAQGDIQTLTLLTANGKSLFQKVSIDLNGADYLIIAVDTITGQGAAASIYVELS